MHDHKRGEIRDNAIAALVTSPMFKTRTMAKKAGKGSYNRKNKHKQDRSRSFQKGHQQVIFLKRPRSSERFCCQTTTKSEVKDVMYANQVSTDFLKNQCAMLHQKLGRKLESHSYSVSSSNGVVVVRIDPAVAPKLRGMAIPERIGSHPVRLMALTRQPSTRENRRKNLPR